MILGGCVGNPVSSLTVVVVEVGRCEVLEVWVVAFSVDDAVAFSVAVAVVGSARVWIDAVQFVGWGAVVCVEDVVWFEDDEVGFEVEGSQSVHSWCCESAAAFFWSSMAFWW